MKRCSLVAFVCLLGWSADSTQAEVRKSEVVAECGDIIEGEFTAAEEQHGYGIEMSPGDVLDFSVVPVGDFLNFMVYVHEPAGNEIHRISAPGYRARVTHTPSLKTGVLSGRGVHRILLQNFDRRGPGNLGVYTIHIGCVLRDGTVIDPGASSPSPKPSPRPGPKPAPEVAADFKGFPGLDPIDFSGSAFPKLGLGIPLEGTISSGGAVFGYRFDGTQGDSVELSFKRKTGNLNLGLVLIDQQGRVVFQSSLVTTSELMARLRLPTTSEYTLGVAQIELLPPASPAASSFAVEIKKF